jgi:hypothetical protein
MTVYRMQVVLPYFTGNDRDVITNQFHFEGVFASNFDAIVEIGPRLRTFYQSVYGATGTGRVNYVDWEAVEIKLFNLDDTPPRIPEVLTGNFTGAGLNGSTIPTEVAMVLSWKAAAVSGVPFQRLYNRIYLGALPSNAIDLSTASSFAVFDPTFTTQVTTAATALVDANTPTCAWVQYSTAGGTPVARDIASGFVDDSPDSQRRRSVDATAKTSWNPTP